MWLRIIIFLILSNLIAFSQQKSIALLPFSYSGNLDENTAAAITSFVQNALVNTQNYKVMDRSQIRKIIEEQNFQNTGLTEDAVKIGKILSSELVVTGNIVKLGTEFSLIINLINVETSQIFKSEKRSARISLEDVDDLLVAPMIQSMLSGNPRTNFNLTINNCIDLYQMDTFSKTDARAQLSIGNRLIGRTDFVLDNNSPVFNKSFNISDYAGETMIISIFDHDITKDELLGQAIITKPVTGVYGIWGNINGVNSNKGQIEITIN